MYGSTCEKITFAQMQSGVGVSRTIRQLQTFEHRGTLRSALSLNALVSLSVSALTPRCCQVSALTLSALVRVAVNVAVLIMVTVIVIVHTIICVCVRVVVHLPPH